MQRAQTMTTLVGGCRDPILSRRPRCSQERVCERWRRLMNGLTRAGSGRGYVAVAVAVAWFDRDSFSQRLVLLRLRAPGPSSNPRPPPFLLSRARTRRRCRGTSLSSACLQTPCMHEPQSSAPFASRCRDSSGLVALSQPRLRSWFWTTHIVHQIDQET